jgi:hypothetical protein
MIALFLTLLLANPLQESPAQSPLPVAEKLDAGLLDPAWFGGPLTFDTQRTGFDFLYLKPGVSLKGRTVQIASWEAPTALPMQRTPKDRKQAQDVTDHFPAYFEAALRAHSTDIKTSSTEGEYVLVGRIVDYQAGNFAKGFFLPKAVGAAVGGGAGIAAQTTTSNLPDTSGHGWITWDVKLVDRATGEVLAAAHHRLRVADVRTSYRGLPKRWAKRFVDLLPL